jgi:hypothetical protein
MAKSILRRRRISLVAILMTMTFIGVVLFIGSLIVNLHLDETRARHRNKRAIFEITQYSQGIIVSKWKGYEIYNYYDSPRISFFDVETHNRVHITGDYTASFTGDYLK